MGDAWVLALDAREPAVGAVADAGGVRLVAPDGGAPPRGTRQPLAVVVVHPATWTAARVDAAVAAAARGGGPAPVPLTVPEAAAWRALVLGLLPARGRVVVLDPVEPEAAVVDRHGEELIAVGGTARRGRPGERGPAELVALARRALDAAPDGPPFGGVLIVGPAGDDLASAVARVTGHPPLLPGDPATAALLGAAALGWAAATVGTPAEATGAPVTAAAPPARAIEGRRRRRPPWWALAAAALVVAAVVGGLLAHARRDAPTPYTYTCPGGVVVAYSEECAPLAPSGP